MLPEPSPEQAPCELTAKRIHDFRVAKNLTREQAAALVGVTAGRWYLWESGSARPVKAAAQALAALIEAAEAIEPAPDL